MQVLIIVKIAVDGLDDVIVPNKKETANDYQSSALERYMKERASNMK
jgi:hypothetical protein